MALENIKIMEEEGLVQRARDLGIQFLHDLQDLLELPFVGDIRGLGLLIGIELVEDKQSQTPAKPELIAKIMADCQANGLIVGRNGDTVEGFNNIITLSPPLCCTDEDFEFMVAVLKEYLQPTSSLRRFQMCKKHEESPLILSFMPFLHLFPVNFDVMQHTC